MTDRPARGTATVTVFGANDPCDGTGDYETGRAVGRTLGEMGFRVANGGYGGTMEASARGAHDAGASTVGVTCSLWASTPNRYIDEVIETRTLGKRIQTLIDLGRDGYVVLPGATGTLAELAWVWELACKGFLAETGEASAGDGATQRPIVCVGDFWRPVIDMVAAARPSAARCISLAASPVELGEYFRSAPGGL